MNNYTDKKDKCITHSETRFRQRYGHLEVDYSEIRKSLLECVKSQTNIVYSHSQGRFKTEYIIFFSDYFRFIYAKDIDEIMSFLPIGKDEKKIIKEFEQKTIKKQNIVQKTTNNKLKKKYNEPILSKERDKYYQDWIKIFQPKGDES